ncbi:uracil-DNA glycosylase [Bacillus alkalicellulosilyticus]|uniref:uracil-DNA glycosylase n=1 Tax=Alkalihalobacterium alkalicellulosilyticum TaxID=1912214 RepID=UPI00099817CD|nr:uracil-DNA glycosylase [Bacillus alkalicellulosilyticus]
MNLPEQWNQILKNECNKAYYLTLMRTIDQEYEDEVVFPPKSDIFYAFELTPFDDVKVVIVGQDPYHGPEQAQGLSFSVKPGVKIPPSLQNIFKELKNDLQMEAPTQGCLIPWAKQGVLLLNTVLTVRQGHANSHKKLGWETFTDAVITALNAREKPVIFLLWGRHAQMKETLLTGKHHTILKASHPSPLSARTGFFGSKPFSTINSILTSQGEPPIDWRLKKGKCLG